MKQGGAVQGSGGDSSNTLGRLCRGTCVLEKWDFSIHGKNGARTWHETLMLSKKATALTGLSYCHILEWFVGLGPWDSEFGCLCEILPRKELGEGEVSHGSFYSIGLCSVATTLCRDKASKQRVSACDLFIWLFHLTINEHLMLLKVHDPTEATPSQLHLSLWKQIEIGIRKQIVLWHSL